MGLADIVDVTITIESAAIVAAGFGIPAIFGPTVVASWGADVFRSYTLPSAMLADGFLSTDPEYLAALALMSQAKHPKQFVVAHRTAEVAQVTTVSIDTITNLATYAIQVNGRTVSFTADASALNTEIRDGLIAAIAALSPAEPVTAVLASASTFTITATQPGIPVSVTETDSKISLVASTPNHGIEDDLSAARAAGANWYGTLLTSRDPNVIYRAAVWTEGNAIDIPSILFAQVSEAASRTTVYSPTGTDLASRLKAAGFNRTALFWHSPDTEYLASAIAGRMLPEDPGTETWALKSLAGVTVDVHSTTQRNNLTGVTPGAGKNANVYYALTSNNAITWRGQMSGGQWIDLIRFVDFLKARISEGIASVLLARSKVPFTDDGIALLVNQVRGVLQAAEDAGKLSKTPRFSVAAPKATDVSSINRANRILDPPITFAAQASGAIHEASVVGTITQ